MCQHASGASALPQRLGNRRQIELVGSRSAWFHTTPLRKIARLQGEVESCRGSGFQPRSFGVVNCYHSARSTTNGQKEMKCEPIGISPFLSVPVSSGCVAWLQHAASEIIPCANCATALSKGAEFPTYVSFLMPDSPSPTWHWMCTWGAKDKCAELRSPRLIATLF